MTNAEVNTNTKVRDLEKGKWVAIPMEWYKFVDYLVVNPGKNSLQFGIIEVDPSDGMHTIEKVVEITENLATNKGCLQDDWLAKLTMKELVDFNERLAGGSWKSGGEWTRVLHKKDVKFPTKLFGCNELYWKE